jgi:hypothetical protein
MSQLVIVAMHFSRYQIVTSRFLAVTFRDITLYIVNNHLIARTIQVNHIFHSMVERL